MATNPKRPQYQDTIESTWGQSVADHVTRRYATPAERDADLAGLSLSDLAGQLVALHPTPGDCALCLHDGAQWRTLPQFRSGAGNYGFNAQAQCSVLFAHPFPAGWSVHAVAIHGATGGGWPRAVVMGVTTANPTGLVMIATLGNNDQGGSLSNASFPCSWHAIGWPAGAAPNESGREGTDEETAALLAAAETRPEGPPSPLEGPE